MPYRKLAEAVLEHWQEARREYERAPGISGRIVCRADMDRLRDEYAATIAVAKRSSMPVPRRFPASGEHVDCYFD